MWRRIPTPTAAFLLLICSTAMAAGVSGAGTDPAGDAPGPVDLTAFQASYDSATGSISSKLTTAETTDTSGSILALLGQTNPDGECDDSGDHVVISETDGTATAQTSDSDEVPATLTKSGKTVTLTATDAALEDESVDCLIAGTEAGSSTSVDDVTDTPAALTQASGSPPGTTTTTTTPSSSTSTTTPPPSTSTTTTTPPPGATTTTTPAPTTGSGPTTSTVPLAATPPPPTAATTTTTTPGTSTPAARTPAALAVSFAPSRKKVRRGKAMTVKVRVTNTGGSSAAGIHVAIGTARGLKLTPKQATLPSLAAGATRTVTLKLKLTGKARKTTALAVSARAKGASKAAGKLTLKLGKVAPKGALPKLAPGGTSSTSAPTTTTATSTTPADPLVGTYWLYSDVQIGGPTTNTGFFFSPGGKVYSGIPTGSLPIGGCTKTDPPNDKPIDDEGTCLDYSYDASTGTLQIGGKTGTYKDGKLHILDRDYQQLFVPPAGDRLFAALVYARTNGTCSIGPFGSCSTYQAHLRFGEDGTFAASSQQLNTVGGDGGGSSSADQGSYEFVEPGHLRRRSSDGSLYDASVGIPLNAAGQPDAANDGLLLDGLFYIKDTSS